MKLQLMFLFMDILMLLACGYLWMKSAFVRSMHRFGIIKPGINGGNK